MTCSVAFVPSSKMQAKTSILQMSAEPSMDDRRSFVTKVRFNDNIVYLWIPNEGTSLTKNISFIPTNQTGTVAAATALSTAAGTLGAPRPANAAATKMWKPVELPFSDTIYDIDFDT